MSPRLENKNAVDFWGKNGNFVSANALANIIRENYREVRVVKLYHQFETPSTRILLSNSYGLVDGGNLSPLEIDGLSGTEEIEPTGRLSAPRNWIFTKKPVRRESNLSSLLSYNPKGETGVLLATVKTKNLILFESMAEFMVIPHYEFVAFRDDQRIVDACLDVVRQVNNFPISLLKRPSYSNVCAMKDGKREYIA